MIEPNIEAERTVIACMLMEQEMIGKVLGEVAQGDFYDPVCSAVFEAICRLYKAGDAVDYLTVSAQCKEHTKALARWCESIPTTAHCGAYIRMVQDTSRRIRGQEKVQALWNAIKSGEALTACQSKAAELCDFFGQSDQDKTLSAQDGYLLFHETKQTPKTYMKTGLWTVDRHIYIERGDYVVVGGRPSSGKTALTLQMLLYMAQSHRVTYFSLETSGVKIFDRLLANYTKTPLTAIKQGQIGKDWEKIAESGVAFTKLNLKVVEAAGWTVDQIRAKAAALKSEAVFIDYIGLIKSEGRSLYERVTQISNSLHIMAQQSKVTVVALSQLSREGKGEPDMTHLRESGAIEQDADAVLLLHQADRDKPHERRLIIAKNKEGRTGQVLLNFNGEYQRFTPVEGRG